MSQLMTRSLMVLLICFVCRMTFGQAAPVQGQDAAWSGPITLINSATVLHADTFPGTDACAKINAAMGALPPTGGVVDARGIQNLQACSTNPFIVPATTGTISATMGLANVGGTSTTWSPTGTAAGSQTGGALFCLPNTFLGIVQSVGSATSLTLTSGALSSCNTPPNNTYTITAKSGELLLGNATYSISWPWLIPAQWRVIGTGRGSATSATANLDGLNTTIQANKGTTANDVYSNRILSAGNLSFSAGVLTGGGGTADWRTATSGSLIRACNGVPPCSSPFYASTLTTITGAAPPTPQTAIPSIPPAMTFSSKVYAITPSMIQFLPFGTFQGLNTQIEFGSSVSNLNVDCNSVPGAIGVQNWTAQEQSYVRDVNVSNCLGIGLDVETSQAQNSGPYSDLVINPGLTPYSVTLCAEILNTGDLRGIHGLTCAPALMATQFGNVGLDLSSTSLTLEDMHFEGFTTGIEVGANGNANNVTLVNASGGAGAGPMNTVVDIANSSFANNNEVGVFGLSSGVPGSRATNTLVDNIMGTTLTSLTDPSLTFYVLGAGTGTNRNRLTSSSNASSVLISPSFNGNPTAPTQALTDSSTNVATTQFTKGLFGTWGGFSNISLASTSTFGGQWTTPSTDGITLTGFDMVLSRPPSGCGTPGALSIVDHSSSDSILMTITTTAATTNYSTTGSVNVSAGHVLRLKVTTADTCTVPALGPTTAITYKFQ
jgi:hypothetical protein